MFRKHCHHSGEQSGVYTPHTLVDGNRNTFLVLRNFVCNTCGATGDFDGSRKEVLGVSLKRQPARKLICQPLPSDYRRQVAEEVGRSKLGEKNSKPRIKSSAPLAMRTFHVDDFVFGAVSSTFTLGAPPPPPPPADPLLFSSPTSSSPESGSSGGLWERKTGEARLGKGNGNSGHLYQDDLDEDMKRILRQLSSNF